MKANLRFYSYSENRFYYHSELFDNKIPFIAELTDSGIEFYINNSRTHTMVGSGIYLNNQRVYECDFIQDENQGIFRVTYHNIFLLTNINDMSLKHFNSKSLSTCKIIGNKYDNPELEKIFKKNNEKRKRINRTNSDS